MKKFSLILSGKGSAAKNMAIDELLVNSCRKNHETFLRFYLWEKPSVTVGYFQDPLKELNTGYCNDNNIKIIRRITGGRGVYHNRGITYTVVSSIHKGLFPKNLKESLRVISEGILAGLRRLGVYDASLFIPESRQHKRNNLAKLPFCFGSTSIYEIVAGEKKLVGSAQRRWTDIMVQQGHIPFSHDFNRMPEIFRKYDRVKMEQSVTSLGSYMTYESFQQKGLQTMVDGFANQLDVDLCPRELSSSENNMLEQLLEEKYRQKQWNLYRK